MVSENFTCSFSLLIIPLTSWLSVKFSLAIPSKHFFKWGCTLSGSFVSDNISSNSSLDKKKNLRNYKNTHHKLQYTWCTHIDTYIHECTLTYTHVYAHTCTHMNTQYTVLHTHMHTLTHSACAHNTHKCMYCMGIKLRGVQFSWITWYVINRKN